MMIGTTLRYPRNIILKMFGSKIPIRSLVYPSAKIFAPWNLEMGKASCVGPHTQIYNKAKVIIKDNCVISQGAFLCTASHDISKQSHALITRPITIENNVWVAADAFIGPGVTVGEGAVVGARAVVFKNVDPWTVVAGNPAKFIKSRKISNKS
ncbi:putative colanic acid biosynthesis acetyltransferase [Saccharicrinis sp. FJH54]|uniref:putative colanic acid biosynthesis acetyltransferase n=1 Tax=Saccharicrinis sp. FJH54 TaxID=3344665 RepID=UPI0035D4EAC7